ncbi:uncharacterized protein Z519_06501 [Cladophialophora bantiana CBS 173.52]|uniref:Uncharacterized protein n=1 Tax=Cladophialophora bantiana (strain ATCC 10958 / CBS 173.52 / CDC B-1940 / NIH 8579) TaxID=1442370 RepID=A0A0D2I733_CLAB1|nr:uncharacterized protein Z519_06501 [Cladophialophora bantiana CBS 173.52]KIW92654.1 hypothetical protein Z519_06501 [Cladophialophora bantiana CBS 173.52]
MAMTNTLPLLIDTIGGRVPCGTGTWCAGMAASAATGTTLSSFPSPDDNVTPSPDPVTSLPALSCAPGDSPCSLISPTATDLVTQGSLTVSLSSLLPSSTVQQSPSVNFSTFTANSSPAPSTGQVEPFTFTFTSIITTAATGTMSSLSAPSISLVLPSTTTASISSLAWTSTACVALGVPDPAACPGGPLDPSGGDASSSSTSHSASISITTSVISPAGSTASQLTSSSSTSRTTSTTLSSSLTALSPALTSVPATTSSPFSNTTAPGPPFDHPHGRGYGHPLAVIIVPLSIGCLVLLLVSILLWRKYHPTSFHKILDSIPGLGFLAQWRKTRKSNRNIIAMKRLGILTGDNNNGSAASRYAEGDTYARHLRKFEEDAARAREKYGFDAAGHPPTSPFSTGNRSAKSGGTPRTPKVGSPWRHTPTKAPGNPAKGRRDIFTTASPSARSGGHGSSGEMRNAKEDRRSLESWEERWYALGTETEAAAGAGPGQSWRKLV